MATSYKNYDPPFESIDLSSQIEEECFASYKKFEKISGSHLLLHGSFLAILFLEILLSTFFLFYTPKSALVAALFSSFILTLFSYFVLLYYFQSKKPEELLNLRKYFVTSCKKGIAKHLTSTETHLFLAEAAERLTAHLTQKELFALNKSFFLASLKRLFNSQDIEKMQELLMFSSIQEHIQLIQKEPLNPKIHTSLAKTYLSLYRLYHDRVSFSSFHLLTFISSFRSEKQKQKRVQRAEASLRLAVEELQIARSTMPQDPWILTRLADCYHLQKKYEDELKIYEQLHLILPSDPDLLLSLGKLYFQLGHIFDGLRIYHELQQSHSNQAEELIEHYSSFLKRI